ncbi:MAG: TIGR00266 family protein [Anaerolineae bacterium]|nr:TIGR00266 family protein [Anaerolineae bacterium]
MKFNIQHTVMQSLEIILEPGEAVHTQAGGMAWMSDGIEMTTSAKGGLGGMLGRALSGSSLMLTTYTSHVPGGMVTFVTDAPGKIIPINLPAGGHMIAQRDTFLVSEESVTLEASFTKKFGAGLFGGEGFVLQKISGPGMFWAEISGECQEYTLAPGQIMRVSPGHIAMFEPTVSYDIQAVKGITNMLFAGEGLFLATLTGPGRVWLQTMPVSNLAAAIRQFIPTKSS